jgi:hypothetical protein
MLAILLLVWILSTLIMSITLLGLFLFLFDEYDETTGRYSPSWFIIGRRLLDGINN